VLFYLEEEKNAEAFDVSYDRIIDNLRGLPTGRPDPATGGAPSRDGSGPVRG
jgi:hypothetical protein